MEVTRIRALRGPNLWTRRTAIEAVVKCDKDECDVTRLPDFIKNLYSLYPQMQPLLVLDGGTPTSVAHALEIATLSLQAQAGCPISFSRCCVTTDSGVYQVIVEYSEESVGRAAIEIAQKLIQASLSHTLNFSEKLDKHNEVLAIELEVAKLRELDEDERLGPSTNAIVTAAVARGIPYYRLNTGSLVQFGWGSRQRHIQAAEIDCTSAIAQSIAQDKQLTKQLLKAAGVPVPDGQPVNSIDEAWEVACKLGLPVVVKPKDGNHGRGVTVNVETKNHLEAAYRAALEAGTQVIIERYIPGNDYRFLVVGDQLIAAARRDPPFIMGDGIRTVSALVDEINRDPRRGVGHANTLTKIKLDEIAFTCLQLQNLLPTSIPAKGQRVLLRNNANLSTGGTATDVTDEVHPELAARVVAAAQMVGIDICGVDVICQSVLKPLEEQNGGIVEVNAAPGLRMHLAPSFGKGRKVGEAVIDKMFNAGDDARIPIIAITGTNGKTTTVRLTAHLLRQVGYRVGMTLTDGVYVNNTLISKGDCSGPRSARRILMHPDVDAAVFETARGGILREGLGFDRCQVAVVTNIGAGDHLGLNYITTVEDLAVLKRVIVQNVAPTGFAVLNADDPITVRFAASCSGNVIYFSRNPANPISVTHCAQGRRVVTVDNNTIICIEGTELWRFPLADIPLTMGGRIDFQVENVLAAVAAVWGVGISWDSIGAGLSSFTPNTDNIPGRFNMFEYHGATVIADYGHNPDAMMALTKSVTVLPARRRIVVISAAGDRRDEDIRNQTRILGNTFDVVFLYQDACQRGRADGTVINLLREGLTNAHSSKIIKEIYGEFAAIDQALALLEAGDLCLILIDQVEESLTYLTKRCAEIK